MKTRKKTADIVKKNLDFNKHQRSKGIKTLFPKQMLQRLLKALAQVKAGNRSENLLNGIRQIIYSLYRQKEVKSKIDTVFMNSANNKSSDSHRLLFNLTDKINLKSSDEYVALSNLIVYYTWKNINNEFKISAPTWNEEFELPDGSYSASDI